MSKCIYTLYWIRYQDYTDPFTDGYIGITSNLDRRFKEHQKTNPHMRNRINKGAICEALFEELSYKDACDMEKRYRPRESIGWNVSVGGDIPPSRKGKKNKIVRRGDDRSSAQKAAAAKHSNFMKGNLPPNAIEVTLFGVTYASLSSAMRILNITYEQYEVYMQNPIYITVEDLKSSIKESKHISISNARLSSNKVKRGIYKITDPEGCIHIVSNGIMSWCKTRGISASNLRRGKTKNYVCEYMESM